MAKYIKVNSRYQMFVTPEGNLMIIDEIGNKIELSGSSGSDIFKGAVEAGFEGTEEEFGAACAELLDNPPEPEHDPDEKMEYTDYLNNLVTESGMQTFKETVERWNEGCVVTYGKSDQGNWWIEFEMPDGMNLEVNTSAFQFIGLQNKGNYPNHTFEFGYKVSNVEGIDPNYRLTLLYGSDEKEIAYTTATSCGYASELYPYDPDMITMHVFNREVGATDSGLCKLRMKIGKLTKRIRFEKLYFIDVNEHDDPEVLPDYVNLLDEAKYIHGFVNPNETNKNIKIGPEQHFVYAYPWVVLPSGYEFGTKLNSHGDYTFWNAVVCEPAGTGGIGLKIETWGAGPAWVLDNVNVVTMTGEMGTNVENPPGSGTYVPDGKDEYVYQNTGNTPLFVFFAIRRFGQYGWTEEQIETMKASGLVEVFIRKIEE